MPRGIPDCLTGDLADHATRAEIVALRDLERRGSVLGARLITLREECNAVVGRRDSIVARVRARAEAAKVPAQDGAA